MFLGRRDSAKDRASSNERERGDEPQLRDGNGNEPRTNTGNVYTGEHGEAGSDTDDRAQRHE